MGSVLETVVEYLWQYGYNRDENNESITKKKQYYGVSVLGFTSINMIQEFVQC